jgi:hypothetical protein
MGDAHNHDTKLLYAKLFPRVREVLMRDWDPIGIADMDDAPEDEYDRYARTLCDALFDPGLSEERIRVYLTDVTETKMGLPADEHAIDRASKAVIALRQGSIGEN